MLTIFMNMWETLDVGRSLDALLARIGNGQEAQAEAAR
jgi:hypothetical protein